MIGKASEIKTAMFTPDITDGIPLDSYINMWLEENANVQVIQIQFTDTMISAYTSRQSALIIYKEVTK